MVGSSRLKAMSPSYPILSPTTLPFTHLIFPGSSLLAPAEPGTARVGAALQEPDTGLKQTALAQPMMLPQQVPFRPTQGFGEGGGLNGGCRNGIGTGCFCSIGCARMFAVRSEPSQ